MISDTCYKEVLIIFIVSCKVVFIIFIVYCMAAGYKSCLDLSPDAPPSHRSGWRRDSSAADRRIEGACSNFHPTQLHIIATSDFQAELL